MKQTKSQITQLRALIQNQIVSHKNLSKVLWAMTEDIVPPSIRYYNVLDTVRILNFPLWEELVWNIYQCPDSGWYVEEKWVKVRVKKDDLDSLLKVLEIKDLLVIDKDGDNSNDMSWVFKEDVREGTS